MGVGRRMAHLTFFRSFQRTKGIQGLRPESQGRALLVCRACWMWVGRTGQPPRRPSTWPCNGGVHRRAGVFDGPFRLAQGVRSFGRGATYAIAFDGTLSAQTKMPIGAGLPFTS